MGVLSFVKHCPCFVLLWLFFLLGGWGGVCSVLLGDGESERGGGGTLLHGKAAYNLPSAKNRLEINNNTAIFLRYPSLTLTLPSNSQHNWCTIRSLPWTIPSLPSRPWHSALSTSPARNQSTAHGHAGKGGQQDSQWVFPFVCLSTVSVSCLAICLVRMPSSRSQVGDQRLERDQHPSHGFQGLFHYVVALLIWSSLRTKVKLSLKGMIQH